MLLFNAFDSQMHCVFLQKVIKSACSQLNTITITQFTQFSETGGLFGLAVRLMQLFSNNTRYEYS